MIQEIKNIGSVRIGPIDLRGRDETYSFPCSLPGCHGKAAGQPLPPDCQLLSHAALVSFLSTDVISQRLVNAGCRQEFAYPTACLPRTTLVLNSGGSGRRIGLVAKRG